MQKQLLNSLWRICRHGVPEQLLSDRGTSFLSDLIQGVCDELGVKKMNTSGYHPQEMDLLKSLILLSLQ